MSGLFDKTTGYYPVLVLDDECYRGDDLRVGNPDIAISMLQIGPIENEQDLHQANGRIKRLGDKGKHYMVAGISLIQSSKEGEKARKEMNKIVQDYQNQIAAKETEERKKRHQREAQYQKNARDKKKLKAKYRGQPSTTQFPFISAQQQ